VVNTISIQCFLEEKCLIDTTITLNAAQWWEIFFEHDKY